MEPRSRRVTITIRDDLLGEIRKQAPNLSKFFADAASERLVRERFRRAVKESAGAWKLMDHPELATAQEVAQYVEALRGGWSRED